MKKTENRTELISDVPIKEIETLGFKIEEEQGEIEMLSQKLRKYIVKQIGTDKFGKKIILLDEVKTTMDLVEDLVKECEMEAGDAMIALSQTHGIGQHERNWVSDRGNLHLNILLNGSDSNVCNTSAFIAAVSNRKMIESFGVENSEIKWVNDIIISSELDPVQYRKIAGILTQIIPSHKLVNIGIGVNCNTVPDGVCLDRFVTDVTTIQNEIRQKVLLASVTDNLLQKISEEYLQIVFGRKQELISEYDKNLAGKTKQVRLYNDYMDTLIVEGKLWGIDKNGQVKIGKNKPQINGRLELVHS